MDDRGSELKVTSQLLIVCFPVLGVAKIDPPVAPSADAVIFLFLGSFIVGLAIQRCGLGSECRWSFSAGSTRRRRCSLDDDSERDRIWDRASWPGEHDPGWICAELCLNRSCNASSAYACSQAAWSLTPSCPWRLSVGQLQSRLSPLLARQPLPKMF